MKFCVKCERSKPEGDFYRHPQAQDGLFKVCKECHKARTKANRDTPEGKAAQLRALAKYRATPTGRANHTKWAIRHRRRNPTKVRARNLVHSAVRDGRLIKKPCLNCGALQVEAHHADYTKPLDVVWLCKAHHMMADKGELAL